MPDQLKPLTVASGHTENALPALGTRDELEDYWQEFQSKVQTKLEKWDKARASSEEEARHVWLKRHAAANALQPLLAAKVAIDDALHLTERDILRPLLNQSKKPVLTGSPESCRRWARDLADRKDPTLWGAVGALQWAAERLGTNTLAAPDCRWHPQPQGETGASSGSQDSERKQEGSGAAIPLEGGDAPLNSQTDEIAKLTSPGKESDPRAGALPASEVTQDIKTRGERLAHLLVNRYGEAMYSSEQSADYAAQHIAAAVKEATAELLLNLGACEAALGARTVEKERLESNFAAQTVALEKADEALELCKNNAVRGNWHGVVDVSNSALASITAAQKGGAK